MSISMFNQNNRYLDSIRKRNTFSYRDYVNEVLAHPEYAVELSRIYFLINSEAVHTGV